MGGYAFRADDRSIPEILTMLNPLFLMDLLRTRIILADEGMVGASGSLGPAADVALLPGGGIVRIFMVGSTCRVGVAHPTGDLAIPVRRLDHPLDFAMLMSSIDTMILDRLPERAARVPALADDIAWSIRHNALPIQLPSAIDIGEPDGKWQPSKGAVSLLGQVVAQAPLLEDAANGYLAGEAINAPSPTRWLDQLDRWIIKEKGMIDTIVHGSDMRWRRIRTTPGLAAAMTRCGDRPCTPSFLSMRPGLAARMQHPSPMLADRTMLYELERDAADGVLIAGLTSTHELAAAGHVGSSWAEEAMALLHRSLGLAGHPSHR